MGERMECDIHTLIVYKDHAGFWQLLKIRFLFFLQPCIYLFGQFHNLNFVMKFIRIWALSFDVCLLNTNRNQDSKSYGDVLLQWKYINFTYF